jgi:hypothetical protein
MPFHPDRRSRPRRPPPQPESAHRTAVDPTRLDPDSAQLLYTPAEAAALLRVRESWLRRRAGARLVPCTFLGRHLRFSPSDLAAIVTEHAQPVGTRRRRRRSTARTASIGSGAPDSTSGPVQSVDPPETR